MGWNDRLPTDPYLPPDDYYREKEEYEAWLDYVEASMNEPQGLTSQNIDPAMLADRKLAQEAPARQGLLSRLWATIFGQKISKESEQPRTKIQTVGKGTNEKRENFPF